MQTTLQPKSANGQARARRWVTVGIVLGLAGSAVAVFPTAVAEHNPCDSGVLIQLCGNLHGVNKGCIKQPLSGSFVCTYEFHWWAEAKHGLVVSASAHAQVDNDLGVQGSDSCAFDGLLVQSCRMPPGGEHVLTGTQHLFCTTPITMRASLTAEAETNAIVGSADSASISDFATVEFRPAC